MSQRVSRYNKYNTTSTRYSTCVISRVNAFPSILYKIDVETRTSLDLQCQTLCPRPHSSSHIPTFSSAWARILTACSAIAVISSISNSPLMTDCTSGSGLYILQSSGLGASPKSACLSVQCGSRV